MPSHKQLKEGDKIRKWIRDQEELPTSTQIAKRFKCAPSRGAYYLTQIRKERGVARKGKKKKAEVVKPRNKPQPATHGIVDTDINVLKYRVQLLEQENKVLRQKLSILKEIV